MGNSASALPYSIGKQVCFVNHGWTLHEGQRKSDSTSVSVFVAKKPALLKAKLGPHFTQYPVALHHFNYSKKLRHPHILNVYATLDTDNPNEATATAVGSANTTNPTGDFIIVTEPCVPFTTWIQSRPPPEQVAWGLESIIRALHFMHASANLSHSNVSPESFYVTPAGDVKLFHFGLVTDNSMGLHFADFESLVTPNNYRSPERINKQYDDLKRAGIHAMDSFALGICIPAFFDNRIPQPLIKAAQRLQTPNIKMRPRLQPLLKCPIFDTPYQKLQLQLEEFAVQDVQTKIMFWTNLVPNLKAQIIPPQLAVHKLLPLIQSEVQTICQSESLRGQEPYRKEVLATLKPMFYIAETFLDADKIGASLGQSVGILFKVNDRGIRGHLLQKASFMADNFDTTTVNEAVFEPLCSGFSDSSIALRDLTLKATAALVPHLTPPNVEKLARYLVRLQSDQDTAIRTNTVIFFSKLAPHMSDTTRQKMLLPAFCRAMKDPFTDCRLSALQSALKAKQFFDPMGIASKVMPAITPLLLDASPEVRREAFMTVDDLLFALRQESERLGAQPVATMGAGPPQQQQPQAQPPSTSRAAPSGRPSQPEAAPSSGGFMGGLGSWMTSKAAPEEAPRSAPVPPTYPGRGMPVQVSQPPVNAMANLAVGNDDGWDDDDDGWGDDDDGLDLSGASVPAPVLAPVAAPAPAAKSSLFAPPTDFFGGFDNKPARPVKASGKLKMPVKKAPKPAVKKLDASDSGGWDDF